MLSYDDLVARAGVDPRALHQQLAVGDPGQVELLASAFYKAGGNMTVANADKKKASTYVAHGYTVDGTSPVNFDAQARSTATSPENLQHIGKILDAVAGDLQAATTNAAKEIAALESKLTSLETGWTTFMRDIGHHLPPDDQEATRSGFIDDAVAAVKAHGTVIDTHLKAYEETIYGAQKSMAALGYVPPAQLDDLYGDGAAYIKQLRALAKQYADKLKNSNRIGSKWAKNTHKIAGQIKPFLNDPYFASAFYGELGPLETQTLPELMSASGSRTASADLKTFSHLFGTAVTNAADDPGMAAVTDTFLKTPVVARVSWDRAAMVSNGTFPPDWLAQAARVNVLDDFAKHGENGFHGFGYQGFPTGSFPHDVGVPSNTIGAWTQALGHNPQAAREAFATMGQSGLDVTITGDPTGAYQHNIHNLIQYSHQPGNEEVGAATASAFEAASGADNEVDGAHSPQATTFAKALFTDLGHDSGKVQPIAAQNFAKIGASYVQEMAAGNDLHTGSIGGVSANEHLAGDNPAFAIPPELAKSFMKTFVGNQGAVQIFDSAAGQAAHHAMLAGARLDTTLLGKHESAYGFNDAAQAYGSVAGSENGASLQVVGKQVEDEKHAAEIMKGILSAGIDMIPAGRIAESAGGVLLHVSDSVWDAMKHTSNMGLDHAYGAAPGSEAQLNQLKDANYDVAMVGDYERTAILREAGYPGTTGLPPDLVASNGQMLNVGIVMHDPHLKQEYYDFMSGKAHGSASSLGPGSSVYEMTKNAAGRFDAAYTTARGNEEGKSGG